MSDLVLIYSLFPSAGEALDCCRALLAERLVACANRYPAVISHFHFAGEEESAEEYPVVFKTAPWQADAAMARIAQLHSYDVPAIVCWSAEKAHTPFSEWVGGQVRP